MRRLRLLLALLAALPLLFPSAAAADAVSRGEEKSTPCAQCHGVAGSEPIANYPKLGGQHRKYLLHTMRAYKSGARDNAVMAAQMAELTDDDLADLAAYYAAQGGDLR